jgi:hypothetical protein
MLSPKTARTASNIAGPDPSLFWFVKSAPALFARTQTKPKKTKELIAFRIGKTRSSLSSFITDQDDFASVQVLESIINSGLQ